MAKSPQDQLWEYAKKADTAKLDELLQAGKDIKGVTYFNISEIFDFVEKHHDQACSMVALTAIGYLRSGKSTNYVFGLHLGLLATIYLGVYQHNAKYEQECNQFFALLKTCVDDIHRLIAEFKRGFDAQFP